MTEGLLREEKIVEEIRGVLDEENKNDGVEIAERCEEIPIKPSSQEVFPAIETLVDFFLFTDNRKIGYLAAKKSPMLENENLKSKRQNNN